MLQNVVILIVQAWFFETQCNRAGTTYSVVDVDCLYNALVLHVHDNFRL